MDNAKSIIEAILFSTGRAVSIDELTISLELPKEEIETIIECLQQEYELDNRGIEVIKIENSVQLSTKKEYYEYIYPFIDKRTKPKLSNAALETLSIIAYNPKITKAEIESIRGVGAEACLYKLIDYGLVEEAGKADLLGKPMTYKTTEEFLKLFGYQSLSELPELPKYKMDENHQIVIEDLKNIKMDPGPERDATL